MASSARRIVVEFLGDDKSASKTATDVEKRFGTLGGKLDKVGQASGKILAAGAIAGGIALYKMGQSAAADEEAAAKLATQLHNAAGATDAQTASVEAWITAQGKAKGFSDDELRPALMQLVNVTHDVGKAQSLASLAMDVSAGTGKSYTSVVSSLVKAQNGSVSGLSRLGVATKNAAGDTLTLQQVTKNMADTFSGAAAKAADTTAGKQRIMAVQMQELGEQIGTLVLPAMEKLTAALMVMADWVSKHTTLVGALVAGLGGLLALLYTVSVAMRAWTAITKVWAAVTKIATGIQWLFNAAMSANPIALVVIAIAALVVGMVIAYKKSETFRKIVDAAFRAVKAAAEFAFDWVKQNWPYLIGILGGPFGVAVVFILRHWDAIVSFFKALPGKILDFFASLPDRLLNIGKRAGHQLLVGFRTIGGEIWAWITGLFARILAAAANLGQQILDKVNPFGGGATAGGGVGGLPNTPYTPPTSGGYGGSGAQPLGLPGGSRVTAGQSKTGGDFTASAPLVINVEGRAVVQAILTFKRRGGNVELGIA